MSKELELYKAFIDGLVERKDSMTALWVKGDGFPKTEDNKAKNELLAALTPEQKGVLAEMLQGHLFRAAKQGNAAFVRIKGGKLQQRRAECVIGAVMIQRFRDRGEPCLAELIAVVFLQKQPFFDKFQQHPADAGPGYA